MKVTVYATHPNALNIRHPTDGPLKVGGSNWELDGFTCTMIADGAVTQTEPVPEKPAQKSDK